jgi:hypothetical protein
MAVPEIVDGGAHRLGAGRDVLLAAIADDGGAARGAPAVQNLETARADQGPGAGAVDILKPAVSDNAAIGDATRQNGDRADVLDTADGAA